MKRRDFLKDLGLTVSTVVLSANASLVQAAENTATDLNPEGLKGVAADKIFRTMPYLQNPIGNGITIMWQTTVPVYSWVEYGTDKEHLQRARTIVDGQVICNDINNKIRINGLEPGQTYYYRICSREILDYQAYKKVFGETAVSDFYTFTMPAPDSRDFTALILNDIHTRRSDPEVLKSLFRQIEGVKYDFVILNGDIIDDPADQDISIKKLDWVNTMIGAHQIPAFYIRGNHEIRNAYSIGLRSLFDYVDNSTYNAFNWGDTRFVCLDCGEDKPDSEPVYYDLNDFTELRRAQADFLKAELKSKAFKKAERRILVHHIPIYGDGPGYNKYRPCLEAWGDILKNAPFDICINAHTHNFSFHPAGSDGNNFPVIVGGGPRMFNAAVMVLKKKGNEMSLLVKDTSGKVLKDMNF